MTRTFEETKQTKEKEIRESKKREGKNVFLFLFVSLPFFSFPSYCILFSTFFLSTLYFFLPYSLYLRSSSPCAAKEGLYISLFLALSLLPCLFFYVFIFFISPPSLFPLVALLLSSFSSSTSCSCSLYSVPPLSSFPLGPRAEGIPAAHGSSGKQVLYMFISKREEVEVVVMPFHQTGA